MYALYWDIMMYCDPSKAVTGKRLARSEKSAESRNRDDGWTVARRFIDGCPSSLYAARYSEMVSGGTNTGTGRLNVAKGVGGDVWLIPADHFGRKVGIVGQPSAAHGI